MNAKCRNPRARSLSPPPRSIGDPINIKDFEFSTNFLHLFRQSALLKSHFVKSRVIKPHSHQPFANTASRFSVTLLGLMPRNCQKELCTLPPSPFWCRLSIHCCCSSYCCPQLVAPLDVFLRLFDSSCCSTYVSVIPGLVLQNTVLQVVVVQVALAEAVTPNRCYCWRYTLPWAVQRSCTLHLKAMSLTLRLLIFPFVAGQGKTIACSLQSLVTFGDRCSE